MPTKFNPNVRYPSHYQVGCAVEYYSRMGRYDLFCCHATCAEHRLIQELGKASNIYNKNGHFQWWFADWECICDIYPDDLEWFS